MPQFTPDLYFSFLQVANQFKPEFMDLFNDVVLFPWLVPQNHMAIARLQMRDVATCMGTSLKKHVILYPSDAAVQNMICCGDISKVSINHHIFVKPDNLGGVWFKIPNGNDNENEYGIIMVVNVKKR